MSKSTDDLSSTCPLCYQDITIYAVGKCDHTICHVCSTRMRALCDQLYCPVCRSDLPQVVFMTRHHLFNGIITHRFPRDRSAKISFENNRVRLEYNKLLAHQCGVCDGRLSEGNFKMLQDHMRKDHELFYCELCLEHLKIFTSERKCYSRKDLAQHRRKGDKEDTSYKGHPLCEFCDKRYFDKDELLKHLRRDHYFCHFCDSTGFSNQYYDDYDNLKVHFRESHFLCEQGGCESEQFSHAFSSDIDLKAHKAAAHGSSFSKFQARQNRQIDVEINLPPRTRERRGGAHGVGRGRAHLLHAENDDVQRALEASIHSVQAEDTKPQPTKEQNKRRKNSKKVPEEDYYDDGHYKSRQPERRPTRPAAEENKIADAAEFPGLLDQGARNPTPFMSSTWIKPQTQGPDFPELNPSAAVAPRHQGHQVQAPPRPQAYPTPAAARPQGYTAPRHQNARKPKAVEDYPALGGGRSGPKTDRSSAPAGPVSVPTSQSPKMAVRKEHVGQPTVNTSKNSTSSKQNGKATKKAQKIDSLSEYPVLGAKGEPDRNHQRTFREPSSRVEAETKAPRQTPSPSEMASSGYRKGVNQMPGKVDSTEYPSLLGMKSSQSNDHSGSTQTKAPRQTPSPSEMTSSGSRKGRNQMPGKVDSSEYPALQGMRTSQSNDFSGSTQTKAPRQTPSPSEMASSGSRKGVNQMPGKVDSSEYPALQGMRTSQSNDHSGSTQTVQSKKDKSSISRSKNEPQREISSKTLKPADEFSYPSPDPSPQTSLEDFPSLSSIATFLNNDKKGQSKGKKEKENRNPAKSKVADKAETNPAPPKKESSKPRSAPPPSQPREPSVAKPPPGFITQPPPGFSSGPPPGFGSVPAQAPPPAPENSYVQPVDYKDRNKELVRKIRKCLKDIAGGFDEFRTLSGQYRTGIMSGYDYYDRCLILLGIHFKGIFDELVSLLPDVDKQQELLQVQRERESSNHVATPSSAVLKIGKSSSAAPWKDGTQKKHKVCPQCQQMVLSKDYESHLNNHQDFPSLGSSAPVKTRKAPNSAWGRMK